MTEIQTQFRAFTFRVLNWFTPENLENLFIKLFLSLLTLLVTMLLVKLLYRLLNRVTGTGAGGGGARDARRTGDERGNGLLPDSFVRSVQVLLNTLLLYGGYFIAAIVILEIFNVRVISAGDLKTMGTSALKVIGILVGARLVVDLGHRPSNNYLNGGDCRATCWKTGGPRRWKCCCAAC